jgi:hypothetical protein
MEEDLAKFLRERGVEEEIITKMKNEKVVICAILIYKSFQVLAG